VKVYEGMFLLDPAMTSDWPAVEVEINRVLDRAEAKVIGMKNWEERRLAYPIGRHKRGLYALTYFQAPPDSIPGIERDVQLAEKILRAMFLRRESMSEEDIQKSLAADPPKSTGRYDDRGGRFGDRGGRGRGDRGPRGGPGREDSRGARPPRPGDEPKKETAGEAESSTKPAEAPAEAPAAAPPVVDAPVKPEGDTPVKPEGGETNTTENAS